MDDYELDLLSKELESDLSDVLNSVDRELEKKSSTIPCDEYEQVQKIGQGTFGEVFKVRHKKTKQYFALKRLKIEHETEGFPITALREIRILSSLSHENVVTMRGICHKKNKLTTGYRYEFFLLFDFCDHDLAGLLARKVEMSLPIAKAIMKQLLTGLYFLHKNNILHRDLKASNILINKAGLLKIADFGLARFTVASTRSDRPPRYTGRVVTLWYRPPEILLNCRHYDRPVDMWGAGCIMAELWTMFPIMQGNSEVTQLNYIIQLCGSITPEVWPAVQHLEAYKKTNLPMDVKRHVREKLKAQISCQSAVDLIDKLLALDPSKRLSADQALGHDFFHEDPPPGDLSTLSRSGSSFLEFLGQQNRQRHHHGAVPAAAANHQNGARYNAVQQQQGNPANFHRGRNSNQAPIPGQQHAAPGGYRRGNNVNHQDQESTLYDRYY